MSKWELEKEVTTNILDENVGTVHTWGAFEENKMHRGGKLYVTVGKERRKYSR